MTRRRRSLPPFYQNTYLELGYAWVKSEANDYCRQLYEFCCVRHLPFVLITQPRRFCTLEVSLLPVGATLSDAARATLKEWVQDAMDASNAAVRDGVGHVDDTGVFVSSLELEHARELAKRVWGFLVDEMQEARTRGP